MSDGDRDGQLDARLVERGPSRGRRSAGQNFDAKVIEIAAAVLRRRLISWPAMCRSKAGPSAPFGAACVVAEQDRGRERRYCDHGQRDPLNGGQHKGHLEPPDRLWLFGRGERQDVCEEAQHQCDPEIKGRARQQKIDEPSQHGSSLCQRMLPFCPSIRLRKFRTSPYGILRIRAVAPSS
jgi:hypothetical protein